MIVTIAPNTAIDHIFFIPKFESSRTIRATGSTQSVGSKPSNVSWILSEMDIPSLALGFAADMTGKKLEALLTERGITVDFTWSDGETRRNIVIVPDDGNAQTTITASTLKVTPSQQNALLDTYKRALESATCVVMGGTLPEGVSPSFYTDLIRLVSERNLPVLFDASEPLLSAGLAAQPTYVKPNRHELEAFAGRPLPTVESIYEAGRDLQSRFGVSPIISLDAEGALAILPDRAYRIPPLKVEVVNAAGAGDAVVAGIAAELDRGQSIEDGLRLGFACATAVLLRPGTAECTRADIDHFLPQIELIPFP
ncbi:MAG: 1-phosphofructokinase family hexose kinase [Chloroflexota bacterium]